MRLPECDVCGADVDPSVDPVRFRPDAASRAWEARAAAGEVGHRPDEGWFCSAHHAAAVEAARSLGYRDGLAAVIAVTGWEPPSPCPRRAETGEAAPAPDPAPAVPAPFDPREYVLVEPADLPHPEVVPGREQDDVRIMLDQQRQLLLDALSPATYRGHWSGGSNLPDRPRHPTSYATADEWTIFDAVDAELDDDGNRVVRALERRVELDGEVRALIRISVGGDATVVEARSGATAPALDRLVVWAADDRFGPWVDAIAAGLRATPVDLLDPFPDLVGVDLAGGRLRAVRSRRPRQWVEWDINRISPEVVREHVDALVADLVAAGAQHLPELTSSTQRHYTPMDGAREPDCPFTDTETLSGSDGGIDYSLRVERSHYSEISPHRVSMRLHVEGLRAHPEPLTLSAYSETGQYLTTLALYRPTNGDLVARVAALATSMPRKKKRRRDR